MMKNLTKKMKVIERNRIKPITMMEKSILIKLTLICLIIEKVMNCFKQRND